MVVAQLHDLYYYPPHQDHNCCIFTQLSDRSKSSLGIALFSAGHLWRLSCLHHFNIVVLSSLSTVLASMKCVFMCAYNVFSITVVLSSVTDDSSLTLFYSE